LSYSTHPGPMSLPSPMGPFEEPRHEAPVGPFRRSTDENPATPPKPGPGFGLLAIDPDSFSRGYRRLKLRHAAMATGAFAMMSIGLTVQPPTAEVPPKPTRAEDTSEMKKPSKRTDPDDDDQQVAGAAEDVARATEPSSSPSATEQPSAKPSQASTEQPAAEPEPEPEPWKAVPIAEFGGIEVYEISDQIQLVGFHEAAYTVALPMTPTDPPAVNHGRAPVNFHSRGYGGRAETMILPTRLREASPVSAIDVAVKAGAPIFAPISGVVTAVKPYNLYNKYPDARIEIAPTGHPELQLTVLHVTGPLVNVGDTLVAGQTPFAKQATPFPFESQIDRFARAKTGAIHPHVHMEFKYR
jgi:hypothetical protein